MSGMNPGFAKYLADKKMGVSHNNTKAPMTKKVPGGKPHAKIISKTPPPVC